MALGPGEHLADYSKLPASAEPPTMQPLTQALSSALLAGGSATTGLDLHSSDQHLEVVVPAGAIDLSLATVTTGAGSAATTTAASGPFSLRITELSGHAAGLRNVLGTYQIDVLDAHGQVVHGVHLLHPAPHRTTPMAVPLPARGTHSTTWATSVIAWLPIPPTTMVPFSRPNIFPTI